jgi:hypothetical protein
MKLLGSTHSFLINYLHIHFSLINLVLSNIPHKIIASNALFEIVTIRQKQIPGLYLMHRRETGTKGWQRVPEIALLVLKAKLSL